LILRKDIQVNLEKSGDYDPFAVTLPPGVVASPRPVYSRPIPGELGAIVREHAGAILAARPEDGSGFVFLDLRGRSAEVAVLSAEQTDKRICRRPPGERTSRAHRRRTAPPRRPMARRAPRGRSGGALRVRSAA
jgi:hypothetical protein